MTHTPISSDRATQDDKYERDLARVPANYMALSPLTFLARSALVYPDHAAWIHGERRATYAEFFARCRRLASALAARGMGLGDTVAVMAPNVPAMLEAHYGVPLAGGVINALNYRLDPPAIAFIFDHGEAKVLITDREFSPIIRQALKLCRARPLVIDIDDPLDEGAGERLGEIEYEDFIAAGDPDHPWELPADEWQAIALNYTSGTTGDPKGVVFHHRGAYLNSVGNVIVWNMPPHARYLWTLPMFHCNGWCFTWALSVNASTHVCLRKTTAEGAYAAIAAHDVTHFCGAPIVLNMLANAPAGIRRQGGRTIEVMTAGSAPPAAVIASMESQSFHVTHSYGLTETYGPAVTCAWHEQWNELPPTERATLKARQGVPYPVLEGLMVADPETLAPCPADGQTLGEVFMRGNITMKGYLKNPRSTQAAFAGGWFHSGDLAVMHPNGYIELKDRSKDIIISGGENISTIEVEGVLYQHPAVLEAAVVARPDETWGETPCAFVTLKENCQASDREIIEFCRQNLAHFKAPRTVVFGPLPKTSTGKILKYALREQAAALK
ncbi:MAG TPA: acyl-CoA synthetase [Pirellulales bacterium]|nr:acyl-CoA synthetase [Pirellulales bacterium]